MKWFPVHEPRTTSSASTKRTTEPKKSFEFVEKVKKVNLFENKFGGENKFQKFSFRNFGFSSRMVRSDFYFFKDFKKIDFCYRGSLYGTTLCAPQRKAFDYSNFWITTHCCPILTLTTHALVDGFLFLCNKHLFTELEGSKGPWGSIEISLTSARWIEIRDDPVWADWGGGQLPYIRNIRRHPSVKCLVLS